MSEFEKKYTPFEVVKAGQLDSLARDIHAEIDIYVRSEKKVYLPHQTEEGRSWNIPVTNQLIGGSLKILRSIYQDLAKEGKKEEADDILRQRGLI